MITNGEEERLVSIQAIEQLKAKNEKLKERSAQAKTSFKEIIENLESQLTQLTEQHEGEKLEKEALQMKEESKTAELSKAKAQVTELEKELKMKQEKLADSENAKQKLQLRLDERAMEDG